MPTARTTIATTTNPLVLVALVWTLLWGYGASQIAMPGDAYLDDRGADIGVLAELEAAPVWEASWSQRYPGCVALALWPQDEEPVAVVVRGPAGGVLKVAPAVAEQQPGRVVGACR